MDETYILATYFIFQPIDSIWHIFLEEIPFPSLVNFFKSYYVTVESSLIKIRYTIITQINNCVFRSER